jgi:polyisoprenoid-binding protein YceI
VSRPFVPSLITPSLIAPFLLVTLLLSAPAASSMDYRINPMRSDAEFGIRLLWLQTISGHFTQIAGEVKLDDHGLATVDARITADSIVMNSDRLRRWVMAPDFFNAVQYPTIRFLSQPITFAMLTSGGVLQGQLTLRGVTQPMRFELQPAHCTLSTEQTCVIEARGSLSRSAFGMNTHRTALSDQVQLGLLIALEHAPN